MNVRKNIWGYIKNEPNKQKYNFTMSCEYLASLKINLVIVKENVLKT